MCRGSPQATPPCTRNARAGDTRLVRADVRPKRHRRALARGSHRTALAPRPPWLHAKPRRRVSASARTCFRRLHAALSELGTVTQRALEQVRDTLLSTAGVGAGTNCCPGGPMPSAIPRGPGRGTGGLDPAAGAGR